MAFRTSTEASAAAHESWARTLNRAKRTEAAREAALAKLEREVDPDGVMTPNDRRKAAVNKQKAHLKRMSQKGVDARQAQRAAARGDADPYQAHRALELVCPGGVQPEGVTHEELASRLGLSASRIGQLLRAAKAKAAQNGGGDA